MISMVTIITIVTIITMVRVITVFLRPEEKVIKKKTEIHILRDLE